MGCVCVWGGDWEEKGRGRNGKNQESGWLQRAFFRFRTCTRTFSLSGLFPFLIFCLPEAAKWKGDKQSLYSLYSLGSCYLFTRKTGDSSCPCTAHCTPQKMFPGWWQCVDRAVTDSLSEGTGSLHSWIGKYFQQSMQLFDHSGIHDSFGKEQMSIVIWLQLHHHLLLSHWLLSLSSQSSRPGLESLFLPCFLIPWLPGTSAAIRNWICILSVQCDCIVLPVSSHLWCGRGSSLQEHVPLIYFCPGLLKRLAFVANLLLINCLKSISLEASW